MDVVTWIGNMIEFPGLSFVKIIVASAIILIFIDAILGLIITSIFSLFRGR